MEFVKLQKKDLLAANDYVPTSKKIEFISDCSVLCIDAVKIAVDEPGKFNVPMPDYYKENQFIIYRLLMGAFVKLYLQKEFEPVRGSSYLMSQDDFDRWSGGHIFNQIDRMKRDPELKEKCFDILEDYSNLRRMFYNEIHSMVSTMNDPCQRIMAMIQMQTTPEAMQDGLKELKALRGQLADYRTATQGGDADVLASAI